jgi:FMN phosphatase YigB (HAD superfamily)
MIEKVIFVDFGQVYFRDSSQYMIDFAKKYHIPKKKVFDVMWWGPAWKQHSIGKASSRIYWRLVRDGLQLTNKQISELKKGCFEFTTPTDGMVELVRRLKKHNRVAVLSNLIPEWAAFLEKKYKIPNEFHARHYSFDYGTNKPGSQFFRKAAKKMNAKPANCVVIDDNKKFLIAVRKTGAQTILFKDARQCETQLRKLGVEL